MFIDLVSAAGSLFIMMMMGVYLRKKGIAKTGFGRQLAGLITTVVLPCAVIKYMSVDATDEQIRSGLFMLLLGAVIALATFCVGYIIYRVNGRHAIGRVLWAGTIGTNISLFGYPVVESLFGAEGMFYYNLMLIPIRAITYAMIERIIVSDEVREAKKKFSIKSLYSPLLLWLLIGVTIGFLHIQLPDVLASTIKTVSGALTPMGMMLCGFTIADADWKKLLKDKWVYMFCLSKFIVCPTIAFFVARLLNADYMQSMLVILFTCFPIGSVVNAYAVKNDCAPVEASAYTALTTLVSLFVVPIAVMICTNII